MCASETIDWEQGELMETLSYHDKVYYMTGKDKEGNEWEAMGVYSCGEIVMIIEPEIINHKTK